MKHINCARTLKWAAGLACLGLMALSITRARADDPLGFYVGGAVGQGRVEATAPYVSTFRENHSAFKVMVGLRAISLIGVELAYVDLGDPRRWKGALSTDVTVKGATALGLLYLPVPIVDIYVKAGLGRLQSTATTTVVCPPTPGTCITLATPAPVRRTNVGFAGGAGAQFKVGSFAVRAEYERFNAAGGNPELFSLGLTWTFL